MSWLFSAIGALSDIIEWFIGRGQRKIGQEQQQNDDAQKTIKQIEAEQNAAVQPIDAADELRHHDF